eukprot:6367464-Amphidinium_carterae.1
MNGGYTLHVSTFERLLAKAIEDKASVKHVPPTSEHHTQAKPTDHTTEHAHVKEAPRMPMSCKSIANPSR